MRKTYIDNIRWITVVLVVIYHVIYMFNGVSLFGVLGPFSVVHAPAVYRIGNVVTVLLGKSHR